MWRGHRVRLIAVATVLVVALGSLLAFAMRSEGNPVRQLDLHDSGIWVTSNRDGFFGRVNKSAGSVDTYFNPPGGAQAAYTLDVRQDRSVVIAWDQAGGRLLPVDVERGVAVADRAVPVASDSVVDLRGGTLAVLEPRTDKVRATRYVPGARAVDLQGVDSSAPVLAEVGAAGPASVASGKTGATVSSDTGSTEKTSALAIGVDGTVYAASATGKLVTIRALESGFESPEASQLPGGKASDLELSAVGSTLVVLDRSSGTLWVGDRSVSIDDPQEARLQIPGPAADQVYVATAHALYAVPVAGGEVKALYAAGTGTPAAPAVLGPCVFAAWAGTPGAVARSCEGAAAAPQSLDRQGGLSRPVFRLNRDQLVLNDAANGRVFDIEAARSLDDWDQIQDVINKQNADKAKQAQNPQASKDLKPKANPDSLGARPGRTTVLNVLDNDTDPAGRVLAIVGVTPPQAPGVAVTIAPDHQSLLLSLPAGAGDQQFTYTVDNGTGTTAQAAVSVDVRVASDNEKPTLRTAYQAKPFAVVAGQTVSVPVTQDWRDYRDGDPVQLVDAKNEAGPVPVTPSGSIEFTAPTSGAGSSGPVALSYRVSDGVGEPVDGKVTVTVLDRTSTSTAAAITQPDVVTGQVGAAVVVEPLRNDLPGADPGSRHAVLALAGAVAPKEHLTIDSDLKTGRLTVTADKAGTFLLDYQAAYGAAPFAPGAIRLDVVTPPAKAAPPTTMPDFAAIRGQVPVMVDVLANDIDPGGGLLTVQSAQVEAVNADQLQVDVIRGRWLRVTPLAPTLAPSPAVVRYTVSNGSDQFVAGDVTVVQLPAVTPDPPRTKDDFAVVRDGDTTLIPVLENDSTESGAFLHLASNVLGAPALGQLSIFDPAAASGTGTTADLGAAYVSRDQVRYVAPAKVDVERVVRVEYIAENDDGETALGNIYVTVKPQPTEAAPDQAPAPQTLEARATSGDTIVIPVPTSGIDPDGDSTTVVGVASATSLGRVVGTSPTSITYQAYPVGQGTDQVSYVVIDRYGKTGTGLARVAVVPPGAPPAPVAMPDTITATPGAKVSINLLSNDLLPPGDPATIADLDLSNPSLPTGVALGSNVGPLTATAQEEQAPVQVISYQVTNSGGPSAPVPVTIRAKAGFNNPPILKDDVAVVERGATSTTVDLLGKAADIDGPASQLKLSKVHLAGATVAGGSVTIPVKPGPQVVAYEVTDGLGATSSAVVYVPGAGSGIPFVKTGSLITVPQNGTVTVALADYVVSPAARPVLATTTDRMWASPRQFLAVSAPESQTKLTVTASNDYIGPGAITLEVTDRASLTDPNGVFAIVTIPVQVGPVTPVLRCPQTPITVVEGGLPVTLNVTAMCHVWTADPAQRDALRYQADWKTPIEAVTIGGSGESRITITAGGAAKPGATGAVSVTVAGTQSVPALIPVTVLPAPKPTFAPVNLEGIKQGDSATVELGNYMRSPLIDRVFGVVSVRQSSGMPATETHSGGRVTLTPAGTSFGTMTFQVIASDVSDLSPARQDRWVTGVVTLKVYGVPDAPGVPLVGSVVQSHAVNLSWSSPDNHGAPIDQYEVIVSTGKTQICQASPCNITGLQNGQFVTFTVRAHNKAGWGKPSAPSAQARPDEAPGMVTGVSVSKPVDHGITLAWAAAKVDGTPVKQYKITWTGNGSTTVDGTTLTKDITGLVNNNTYDFTITAANDYGPGPTSAPIKGQSSGAPGVPGPVITSATLAGGGSAAVRVSWATVDPNGPKPVTYTVNRTGGAGPRSVCTNVQTTECLDDGVVYDGTIYQYTVTSTNATGGAAHSSTSAPVTFKAIGTPLPISTLNATAPSANTVTVSYSTVNSRGASATVKIYEANTLKSSKTEVSSGGATSSQTFSQGYDGNTHSYYAVVCNEAACGSNGNATSVKPWTNPTISTYNVYVSGTQVHVAIGANGGGLPARLTVSASGTHPWSGTYDIVDGFSNDFLIVDAYSVNDSISVTLADTSGRGRPSVSRGPTGVSTPPPPPIVALSFGAACANVPNCHKVVSTASNFPASSRCHLEDSMNTPSTATGSSTSFAWWTQGNGSVTTVNWVGTYPSSYWIKIVCDNGAVSPVHYGGS